MKSFMIAVLTVLGQLLSAQWGAKLRDMPRYRRRALGYRLPIEPMHWRKRLALGLPLLPIAGAATDTVQFGRVEKFEDFLVTALADMPEIDTQSVTGGGNAIVSGGADGRLRIDVAATIDDDVGAITFGALQWTAGDDLYMEARIFLSSIVDNKYFVGFGDTVATTDETTFSATTDTITLDTMSDAIGILYDEDSTTKVLWAVAGATDAVTANKALAARLKPVADTALTLGVYLSSDRKSAQWYVNGEEVYRLDSATVLVAAVDLVPGVWAYEQATAFNLDIDYLYGRKSRSTA